MTESRAGDTGGKHTDRRHEPDSIRAVGIASIGIGLIILVILALLGIAVAFRILIPPQPLVSGEAEWIRQHGAPGVQPNQAYDRERIMVEEEAYLNQYGWQDKGRGIARIPIQRGIEIMARQHLKVEWPTEQSAGRTGEEAK